MNNPIILYQAYGAVEYLNQALYSILTLRHYCPDLNHLYRVIVYTDNPEYFECHGIESRQVSPEQIRQWRGRYNFEHRFKIEMIRDASQFFDVPLLYMDSDTYWRSSPAALFSAIAKNNFVMYSYEGLLSETYHPALHRIFASPVGQRFGIDPQSPMWNAGVIGLPSDVASLLTEVLKLTDDLFQLCYQHNWLEQFAFSHILSKHSSIVSATEEVDHYWGYNMEARIVLKKFFAERFHQDENQLIAGSIALTTDLESRSRAIQNQQGNYWSNRWQRNCRSIKKRLLHLRVLLDTKLHNLGQYFR